MKSERHGLQQQSKGKGDFYCHTRNINKLPIICDYYQEITLEWLIKTENIDCYVYNIQEDEILCATLKFEI